MAELIIHSGKYQGRKLLINEGDVVIGRDSECQIRLASSDVSRKHCIIRLENGNITVEDLKSRNGTYANDLLIQDKTVLEPGDFLRVGPMVFRVPGEKKNVSQKPSLILNPSNDSSATDDDIASWLTDDDSSESSNAGETTIIQDRGGFGKKGKRGTVAEEAADVIMRHWQQAKEEQNKNL